MTTSHNQFVLSEISGEQPIPLKTRQYFRRLLQDRIHELILEAFIEQENRDRLTQKQLAKRLEKGEDQISRWLHTASNLEIDTIADLLLGMAVRLDELSVTPIADLVKAIETALPPIEREPSQQKSWKGQSVDFSPAGQNDLDPFPQWMVPPPPGSNRANRGAGQ
jgi:hypothetical protein